MNRVGKLKSAMLELAKLIHEAIGIQSPRLFIAFCILLFGIMGGCLGWAIDKAYRMKLVQDQAKTEVTNRPIPTPGAAIPSQPSPGQTIIPLKFSVKSMGENYPEKMVLGGIEWKPEYLDDRLRLFNNSNVDFSNVDLVFTTNQSIAKVALFRNYPDAGVIPIGLANASVFVHGTAQPQERITTSHFRIHCVKIFSNSMVEFIMAVTNRKEPKRFHILQGSYEVGGQKYPITVEENFVA